MRAVSAVLGWLVVLVFGVAVVHAFTPQPPAAPVAPVWGSAAGDMSAAAPAVETTAPAGAVPVQVVKAPKTARSPRTARVAAHRAARVRVSTSHRVRSVRAGTVKAPQPVQVVIVQMPAPTAAPAAPVVLVVQAAPVVP